MIKLPQLKVMLAIPGIFFLYPETALAYLDPGTGSFILQMLIAGILAVSFSIKMFWYRVKDFCKNLFGKKSEDEEKAEEDE